jgi:tetratricopeptide (TPR) repeat protein
MLLVVGSVMADTVTRRGASFTLRDCSVQMIAHGKVHYIGPAGQPRSEPHQEIATIGFDGVPALDKAEQHLQANDLNNARSDLLKAYLQANNDTQRLWIHSRLALLHDLRGEYVPAARHFAGVLVLDPHVSWLDLAPISEPAEASHPAMREGLQALRRAGKAAQNQRLGDVINDMIKTIEPMYRRRDVDYDGPRFEPGETLSGVPIEDILRDRSNTSEANPSQSDDETRRNQRKAQTSSSTSTDDPAAHIDALLDAGQFNEALARCKKLAKDPSGYPIPRLLYQYGRTLRGANRPRDAAVQFTRCAIHFPQSRFAALSLLAASEIHVSEFEDPRTAQRLLHRAREIGETQGYEDIIEKVHSAGKNLPEG